MTAGLVNPSFGNRWNNLWNAICASTRAKALPAQIWTPNPKDKCLFGRREMSKRSGFGNWDGSRLAALIIIWTVVSAGIVTPDNI
jgi:hypothetical protein